MKIAIISGSHRKKSESLKVARFAETLVARELPGVTTYLCSLSENPLPLWDEGVWSGDEKWKNIWGPIAQELQSSDALVVISPEWGGMVPAGLKNFFLLCSSAEVGNKPGLIVTVSASRGGAYPVAELRMSSTKNNYLCYIPEHVIVRNAAHVLNGDTSASEDDSFVRQRLTYALKLLGQYAAALRQVRESGVIDYKTYPFGM